MNAEQLLTHFDRIADAPDAIPRLRRFILDLAVRGKLVEQDPNDEPADIFFTDGKRRNLDQYVAAMLPTGWLAAPVGSLLNFQYGKGMKASERLAEGPVPVFGSNGIVGYCETPLTETPSIIVGRKGSAGALNLCNGPSWTTDVAYFVGAPAFFDIRYLLIGLQTLKLESLGKGVKPGLSRSDAYELPLSVPPLAEQRRIVAKVDELMALCDRLEAAQKERENTRNRVTAASLARLNAPDPDPAVFQNHAAFALDNLPPLTTRPDQIKVLRQTILNLAVRGKLVPQDPEDEPAAELLKRIAAEKTKLSKERKLRAQRPLPPISESDVSLEIPTGWQWVRLGDVIKLWSGFAFKSEDFQSQGIPVIRIGDLQAGKVDLSNTVCIQEDIANSVGQEFWIPSNALLIAMSGATTGKVAFNRTGEKLLLNQRVGRIETFLINVNFVRFFFDTIIARNLEISFGTAIPNLSAKQINETIIPLPPLAEQRRIVAKVNELMELSDRLEASLDVGGETRRRLGEAMLHEALEPGAGREVA